MWKLIEAMPIEATLDDSGVHVVIHRIANRIVTCEGLACVRADLMDSDEPIVSFIGPAENVRKHLMKYIRESTYFISCEHASYIGAELYRASIDPAYCQD